MGNLQHLLFVEIGESVAAMAENGILDEGDALLAQSFVEGETAIPDLVGRILNSMDEDEILIAGLAAVAAEHAARKRRLEQRLAAKRSLIEMALLRAEIKRLEVPNATLSLRRVPASLGTVDEALVPSEFFVVPPPRLDRKKLTEALKTGRAVEGAMLNNGGMALAIRRG